MDINVTLTFFPYDIEYVKDNFISAIGDEYNVRNRGYKGVINEYYIQQYNAPKQQFVLFSPKSNPHTTIMYANIMDGYVNLIEFVAEKCGMEYYNISICDGTSQMMEAYHFHYYSSAGCRHILCYQDPQWVFYEEGEPLEFENVELYKLRLKKKRLNKEIILQYLNHLGWNLWDENFWHTENVVYEFEEYNKKMDKGFLCRLFG